MSTPCPSLRTARCFAQAVALLATLSLPLACSGSGSGSSGPTLQPPENTGQVTIEMSGVWVVSHVEPVQDVVQLPPVNGALVPGQYLSPPAASDEITMTSSKFVEGAGLQLDLDGRSEGSVVESYHNRADGRRAFYERVSHSPPNVADGGSFEMRIAAGAVDQETMLAHVQFLRATAFAEPSSYTKGLFLVTLKRK